MFRRFLSRADFDNLALTKTKIAPARPEIIKWRSLKAGTVFRLIDRIAIPATEHQKIYVVLETEHREIIHVWITPIINEELKKYDLSGGNIFIKPLGKKLSNTTGKEYFNFAIVIDTGSYM